MFISVTIFFVFDTSPVLSIIVVVCNCANVIIFIVAALIIIIDFKDVDPVNIILHTHNNNNYYDVVIPIYIALLHGNL